MDAEARETLLEAAADAGARGQVEVLEGRRHLLVHLLHQVAVAAGALQGARRAVATKPDAALLHEARSHQGPHVVQRLLRGLLQLGLLVLLLLLVLLVPVVAQEAQRPAVVQRRHSCRHHPGAPHDGEQE
eukprot:3116694-Rhodomonas_salina.1